MMTDKPGLISRLELVVVLSVLVQNAGERSQELLEMSKDIRDRGEMGPHFFSALFRAEVMNELAKMGRDAVLMLTDDANIETNVAALGKCPDALRSLVDAWLGRQNA